MLKIILISLIFFTLSIPTIVAKDETIQKPTIVHGFGFAAGPYAGIGL